MAADLTGRANTGSSVFVARGVPEHTEDTESTAVVALPAARFSFGTVRIEATPVGTTNLNRYAGM
jgi:hypothetical protein